MRPSAPRVSPDLDGAAIERVPWSQVGPEFVRIWGRHDPPHPEPEHLELVGPTGSGKSTLLVRMLHERVAVRQTSVVYIATKPADRTIESLKWPVVDDWRGIQQNEQAVFWPRTSAMGEARKEMQDRRIRDLLEHLWTPQSNTIVVFDEIAYVEKLSPDMRNMVEMYLREGRSLGITCVMGKQRPQGVTREMHAQTTWTICFGADDDDDKERCAELFGNRKLYTQVLGTLDRGRHEFLMRSSITDRVVISWIDYQPRRRKKSRAQEPAQT